jgi:hypothetical protein
MIALGKLMEAFIGTDTLIDGFTCIPTVPASLVVQVTPGSITTLDVVDDSSFASLAPDSTPLMKMGILLETLMFTITPPTTSGYAQNYLIQIGFSEDSDVPVLLPYYNQADPEHPFEGPADSGVEQDTRRAQNAVVNLKPGMAAPAGTQTTPGADIGYVPAFYVTVAQGQTTITSADIHTCGNAPFIPLKLPQVATATQGNAWNWTGIAGGTANALTASIGPTITAYGSGGMRIDGLGAYDNTAAATINVCGVGAVAIKKYGSYDLDPGDILAGGVFNVEFDGSVFQLLNPATENSRIDLLATSELTFAKDNGGVVLPTGVMGELKVDIDCTIVGVWVLADQVGSCVIDIWKDTFANFPPTIADTICASAKPTISSDAKCSNITLTGWTTHISAGDVLRFNLDSVTSISRLSISIKVARY